MIFGLLVAAIVFLAFVAFLVAAAAAVIFHITPMSVAIADMSKQPNTIRYMFMVAACMPVLVVILHAMTAGDDTGWGDEIFRLACFWMGAVVSLFGFRADRTFRNLFAWNCVAAALLWFVDYLCDNENWKGFGVNL